MAYREFQNETPYAAPEIGDMPRQLGALHQVMAMRNANEQRRYDRFDDYKEFVSNGKIPKYVNGINNAAHEVTKSVHGDYVNGAPAMSFRSRQMQGEVTAMNSEAKANEAELARKHKVIMDTAAKDHYYVPDHDIDQLSHVVADDGNPISRQTISGDAHNIASLDSNRDEDVDKNFNLGKAIPDYVKSYQKSSFENGFKGTDGAKSANRTEGVFFDKNGNSNVTDEHVAGLMNFHPKVKVAYTHKAMDQVSNEIDQNIAADPNYLQKIGANNKAEALSAVIQNPNLNTNPNSFIPIKDSEGRTINRKLNINDRAVEMARNDLKLHEGISKKVDIDMSDASKYHALGVTNKDIETPQAFDNVGIPGPSIGVINPKKQNMYPTFDARGKVVYNTDTGQIVKDGPATNFTLSGGIKQVPVTVNGTPFTGFKAKTTADLVQEIKDAPQSLFEGPNAIVGSQFAMQGKSVNKKQVFEAANAKMTELQSALHDDPNNAVAKQQLDGVNGILKQINLGEEYNPELVQKMLGVDIVSNQMIPIAPGDQNDGQIKAITGGLNLNKVANQGEFKAISDAINARVNQGHKAVANYYDTPKGQVDVNKSETANSNATKAYNALPKGAKKAISASPDDFTTKWNALKPGETIVGPDGKTYKKK